MFEKTFKKKETKLNFKETSLKFLVVSEIIMDIIDT